MRVPLDGLVDADRAGDRVLVGLVRGAVEALLGDAAAPDELVDQRVVLGQLDHLAGAQHVDAAVADVGDEAAVARDEQGRGRRPHAPLLRLGLALVVDGLPGRLDGMLQEGQHILGADVGVALGVALDRSRGPPRPRCGTRAPPCCEATSPEACPPIPSATTNNESFLSTRKLSSLASRFFPTSVAAQKESSMRDLDSAEPPIAITNPRRRESDSRRHSAGLTAAFECL